MAGKLIFEIGLDGAGFERGLQRIGSAAASSLKNFVVGAFGIYGVQQAITKTVESCTELVDASKKLGVTVEQLQVLRQAAKDSGMEFEKLVTSVNKLAAIRENILQGGKGSAGQLAALGRLGVSAEMVRTMTAGQLMTGPIAATLRQTNPADIANDLKTIFGRAFGDLIPTLQTDMEELGKTMKESGAMIENDTAQKMKVLSNSMTLLNQVVISSLAPALLALAEFISFVILGTGKKVSGWAAWWGANSLDTTKGPGSMINEVNASHADAIRRAGNDKASWVNKDDVDKITTAAEKPFEEAIKHLRKALEDAGKTPIIPAMTIPGGFTDSSKMKAWKTPEDALISVGNFLGAGRGAIGSVAEQHLAVAREQLDCLKSIDDKLDDQSGGNGGEDGGIDYGS